MFDIYQYKMICNKYIKLLYMIVYNILDIYILYIYLYRKIYVKIIYYIYKIISLKCGPIWL